MKNFKMALSVTACIAFLGGVFWFVGKGYFSQRILDDMTSCNMLFYDKDADVYIARSNDNSKIYFDENIFGIGALKKTGDSYTSAFTLEVKNEKLVVTPPSNVVQATLSTDRKYIATVSIGDSVQIYTYPDFNLIYSNKEKIVLGKPFSTSISCEPYIFWTQKGLAINVIREEKLVWDINKSVKQLVIIVNPENNNERILEFSNEELNLYKLLGLYDKETLALLKIPRDIVMKPVLLLYNINTNKMVETSAPGEFDNFISWPKGPFLLKRNVNGLFKIFFESKILKNEKIPLPTINGKQLTLDQVDGFRKTSRDYIYFNVQTKNLRYLLDPETNCYTEIEKNRVPY